MRRSRFVTLAAAVTAAAVRPAVAETPKVRLGAVLSDSYAEPFFGLDGGFFAKAGLNVEVTTFGSGGQITTAVAGGAIDAGIADAIQVGAGFLRGLGFAYFAGGVEYSTDVPTTQLCVVKNGPVAAPKDLAGKTLGVFGLRSMPELATREFLKANGVDVDGVKFVELPPSAMVPAIARGTIAAGVVTEPDLSAAGEAGVVPFAKTYDWCAKHFYINSWFAKREWLAANAETARALVRAIYETARWSNTHHSDTLPILAKYTKMLPEKIAHMARGNFDTALDPKKLAPPIALATQYHLFDKPLTADQLVITV